MAPSKNNMDESTTISTQNILALDLGGTGLKCALVHNGMVTDKKVFPTDISNGLEGIKGTLTQGLDAYRREDYCGVAISSAGEIEPIKGYVIYATPNLPDYTGFRLTEFVSDYTKCRCTAINDGQAALLGELYSRGKQGGTVLMLTLGTGVGGAMAVDGKIVSGYGLNSPGHIQLVPDGISCNCGKKGCIEQYISGSALGSRIKKSGLKLSDTKDIWRLYKAGNSAAKSIIADWLADIRKSCDAIYALYKFELVILGGGLADSGEHWFGLLTASDKYSVELSCCGNNAGLIGAYAHYIHVPKAEDIIVN